MKNNNMYVLARLMVNAIDLAGRAAAMVAINERAMYKIFLLSAYCTLFLHRHTGTYRSLCIR